MLRIKQKSKRIPKVPRIKGTRSLESKYVDVLTHLVDNMKRIFEQLVLPYLEQISLSAQSEGLRLRDSWDDQLEQLMTTFNLTLSKDQDYNRLAQNLQIISAQVNNQNSDEIQRVIKEMFGIDARQYEPWLKSTLSSFTKENISLIKDLTAKTEKDIFGLIQRDIKQGKRVETIKKELFTGTNLKPGYFNSVKTRAELIARDQVGKLNGQLSRMRQKEIGIDFYIWRTSDDERVRESHRVLDDKVCSWNDPSVYADTVEDATNGKWKSRASIGGYIGEPGEDYQCRCYAEPVFDTILESE